MYVFRCVLLLCIDIAPFTGENDSPIYIAIDGIVLDVTKGREYYGPGSGYNVFAGR